MSKRLQALLVVCLLLGNLIAANALLHPVAARVDLTEHEEFTLSPYTRQLLNDLPDQIGVYGYFSEKTHRLLRPLIPQVRDLLEEYRVQGRGKVALVFGDPKGDEEMEKEAHERFGVDPAAFEVSDQYESGVTSAYFHIVVAYGDQHQKLEVDDIVDVQATKGGQLEVRLQNLEYQLTAAIHRSLLAFGALETRVADEAEPIEVAAFLSQEVELKDVEGKEGVREFIDKNRKLFDGAIEQLNRRFKKGLSVQLHDPAKDPVAKALAQRYKLRPVRASLDDDTPLYVGVVVRRGKRADQIPLVGAGELSPADLVAQVEGALRRLIPGALKRVGMVTDKPDIPPQQLMQMQMMGQQPPTDQFEQLRQQLRATYEVRDIKLEAGRPVAEVDVLLVLKPKDLGEKEAFALDQYLMHGYPVIVFADHTELDRQAGREEIRLSPITMGLDDLLQHYGVTVRKELCQDVRCLGFTLPRMRRLSGNVMIQDFVELPYSWFLDVRADGIERKSPATAGLDRLGMMWASPLGLDPAKQPEASFTELLKSSAEGWATAELREVPPPEGDEVDAPEETAAQVLAVAVNGKLTSFWKGKKPPAAKAAGDEEDDGHGHGEDGDEKEPGSLAEAAKGDGHGAEAPAVPPLEATEEGARLVVVGDADMVSDIAASRRGPLAPVFAENVQLVTNLIDWALLDEGLIGIRSRGARQRPLESLEKDDMRFIQYLNYAIPGALVVLFGVGRLGWRSLAGGRRRRPTGAALGTRGRGEGLA